MPLAYLTFLTGIAISAVAIYYSVLGLASIFSAAVIPIVVMGTILELSKLVTAWWLKANWARAPLLLKSYMLTAVVVLMLITSMGIFGFLSKAHSDQSIVSGDVQSKISIYDEKIKTAKENIDANRRALKQMDEAVDQVMGRSADEKGADKAVALRRSQAKERTRLLSEIAAEQKIVAQLSEERAPIAAEVRKVEAEVGPIKYIAAFVYGDNPDANVLEKAVTWVIIVIVLVFDPLAVLLLLASQMSFQWAKEQKDREERDLYGWDDEWKGQDVDRGDPLPPADKENYTVVEQERELSIFEKYPYLAKFDHFKDLEPMVAKPEKVNETTEEEVEVIERPGDYADPYYSISRAEKLQTDVKNYGYSSDGNYVKVHGDTYTQEEFDKLMNTSYIQNEEQEQSGLWQRINSKISEEEYIEQSKKNRQ